MTAEEARARDWREARRRRVIYERERAADLAGSTTARRALAEQWEPLSRGGCDGEEARYE